MTAVSCHGCGALIVWAEHDGERIALSSEESLGGPHRYRVTQYAVPFWRVEPVATGSGAPGHIDHRTVCPARVGGRRSG